MGWAVDLQELVPLEDIVPFSASGSIIGVPALVEMFNGEFQLFGLE